MNQCWETTWRTGVKSGKALVFPDHIPTAPARKEAIGHSLSMQIMVWFCVCFKMQVDVHLGRRGIGEVWHLGVFCILQEMVSQLWPPEGAQKRHRKSKVYHYSQGPKETVRSCHEVPTQQGASRKGGSAKQLWEQRDSEALYDQPGPLWEAGWRTPAKSMKACHCCVWLSLACSQGTLWQWLELSQGCTWSPG